MTLIAGFLLAALSFPLMPMKRWLPRAPIPDLVKRDPSEAWTHHAINVWVESVRADPQWWGKCLAFFFVLQAVVTVVL